MLDKPRATISHGGIAGALNVVIVEDDDSVRTACATMAGSLGCHVRVAESIPSARSVLAEAPVDVVFLDMRLPGGTGNMLLEEIRSAHPRAFVVIMTAYATVNSAVELMRSGAGDFLQKPFALQQVTTVLESAAQRKRGSETSRALQDRLRAGIGSGRLLGNSAAMEKLYRIISKVAFTRHPVIISGESGTGKEIVARTIHANGPHAISPFIPVSCDALLSHRLEEELFGCEAPQGGPGRKKLGLLASAGDGTVYLDEVAALEPAGQARLARALEERRIRPLGSTETHPLCARVLASTTCELQKLVDDGRFRKDLFYRLNVINLRVPPLRERTDDILLLAEHFLERQRQNHGLHFVFSEEALHSMLAYPWVGNVGELEAMIERACSLSNSRVLEMEDLSTQVRAHRTATAEPAPLLPQTADHGTQPILTLQEIERNAILNALQQMGGDKVRTAKVLGIGKTTLYRKLKEFGLDDDAL